VGNGDRPGSALETVRVTVVAGERRADLVLPAALPLAELVPGLARAVGLLDGHTAYGGFRLSTADGRRIRADAALVDQGVRDGHVLILVVAVDDPDPPRYDDEAEAMADAVERAYADTAPGAPASGRRTDVAVVCACWTAGLVAAVVAAPGRALLVLLAGAAATLLVVAVVLSRLRGRGTAAVLVAWLACAQAAGSGAVLASQGPASTRIADAGAALVLVGAASSALLVVGRLLLLPPVVVGSVLLVAGLSARALPVRMGLVVTAALMVVTVVSEHLPAMALAAARGPTVGRHVDEPVDLARVHAWARAADRVLLAGSASVATLLVVAAPFAVSVDLAGGLGSALCCVVVLLRARGQRDRVRAVGRAGGLLGLLATAVSVLWLQPGWRTEAAATLYLAGAASLAHLLGPRPDPLLVERLCELTRSGALVALPSTLLVASGVLPGLAR
jgi:hypothetical protein